MGALDGVKVIEIGGVETLYAGKLLADQGAEVTLVEPVDGHVSRRLPPLVSSAPHDVASVSFAYYNGNKRSVVLPLAAPEGVAAVGELASRADVVLAGGRPSELRTVGIDPEKRDQRTVLTSITPYGWTGPRAEWHADDLTLMAMGGLLTMGGYHDGRPLKAPGIQAYVAAGIFGAIGTMGALIARDVTGSGEHVDVSAQEAVVMALENAAQFYDFEGTIRRRHGGDQVQAARGAYACRDGYVYLMAGVRAEAKFWRKLLSWFEDDGTPGREILEGEKWLQRDYVETEEAKDHFFRVFSTFCAGKTQAEIYAGASQRGIPLAPINDLGSVLQREQFAARQFLQPVTQEDWPHGPAVAPGAPYQMSASPWRGAYAPPRLVGAAVEVRPSAAGEVEGVEV